MPSSWLKMNEGELVQTNQINQTVQSELTLQGLLTQDFNATQNIAYHEMDPIPVREVNDLAQLSVNIEMLANLRSKIQFMNREIRYLMKV